MGKKMIASLKGHYKIRIQDWETFGRQFLPGVSGRTVKRAMNKWGYHKCRACQKSWISQDQADQRVTFCSEKGALAPLAMEAGSLVR
jgi:hypothetical protein